jgi:hypothetical protein
MGVNIDGELDEAAAAVEAGAKGAAGAASTAID